MAGGNLYESIFTRNASLAKFFDENHNVALAMKKTVGMIVSIAEEQKQDASSYTFEVYAPKGADVIVWKLKKKGE